MKNLFYASALAAMSILAMSCTSTTTTAESINTTETTTNINSETTENNQDSSAPIAKQAIIIDVRTQGEWDNDGHAPCHKLIPLDELEQRMEELRPYGKITVVCRSGGRAGRAKQFLESKGFGKVTNAGPWQNAECE